MENNDDVVHILDSPTEPGEIIDLDDSIQSISVDVPDENDIDIEREVFDHNEGIEALNEKSQQEIVRVVFSNAISNSHIFNDLKSAISQCISKYENIEICFVENNDTLIVLDANQSFNATTNSCQAKPKTEEFLFQIDTKPDSGQSVNKIPSYRRSIQNVLDDSTNSQLEKSTNDASFAKTSICFNCSSENHMLRDCPEERDQRKIQRAKKNISVKHERYHVDVEQRFNHLKPGQLSDNLRKAFELRRREVPSLFYKMRLLGYPPGWLEDAKVAHSGIHLIDSQGNQVADPTFTNEDVRKDKHTFDISKIVRFPGFNSDPGPHYHDDYKYYKVPKMSPSDDVEKFIETFGENIAKGYKRKQLKNLPGNGNEINLSDNYIEEDMDMQVVDLVDDDDDDEIVPNDSSQINNCETEKHESSSSLECLNDGNVSPTLQVLEEKQKMLLSELEKGVSDQLTDYKNEESLTEYSDVTQEDVPETEKEVENVCEPITVAKNESISKPIETETENIIIPVSMDVVECEKMIEHANFEQSVVQPEQVVSNVIQIDDEIEDGEVVEMEDLEKLDENVSLPLTPVATTSTESIIVKEKACLPEVISILGTPVLRFSPYEKLPSYDDFRKGVSDVINYENLPDSTGKYQQMKKVIKKVRQAITRINQEDSN